jgi:predicted RNA binding protein YcfA (HicA-like mRNA interferase family)
MKAQDIRKFTHRLGVLCAESDVELKIERKRGSHLGLIIRDPKTDQKVTLVIARHKEVSPGVQREILKHATWLASRVALGELVREIIERLTGIK